MLKVDVGNHEPLERALKRLKKKLEREGIMKILKARKNYEKPSEKRRRKMKVSRFSAMLAARYADV